MTSIEWSHRIEWNDGWPKSSMPGMSGSFGRLSRADCGDDEGWEFVDRAIGRSNTNRPGTRRLVVGRSLDPGPD